MSDKDDLEKNPLLKPLVDDAALAEAFKSPDIKDYFRQFHLEIRFGCGCRVRQREPLFGLDRNPNHGLEITSCDMSNGCYYDLEKAKEELANPPSINGVRDGIFYSVMWIREEVTEGLPPEMVSSKDATYSSIPEKAKP